MMHMGMNGICGVINDLPAKGPTMEIGVFDR